MPFVKTAVRSGTKTEVKRAIVEGIHQALVVAIGMPEDELFNLVTDYEQGDFFYDKKFNGVARTDNLVLIEITMRRGRSDLMKKNIYEGISRNLKEKANIFPGDVFIFIHENDYSDWSVGHGQFAMSIVQQRSADFP